MAYEKEGKREESVTGSPRCEWNDHGAACNHRGILSPANLGRGPWYCREHFYKLRGYHDMEDEKLRGNQVPKTLLHSFAVDELHQRMESKNKPREPGEEG